MSDNKKMYDMVSFYNAKRDEQKEDDKITSIVRMDSFKIDNKVDIDFGEIYFVTREKQIEGSKDSFMYYEIYSTKDSDKPIAKTNELFEIEILDEKLNNEFIKYKLDLEKDKKVIREMVREDDEGNLAAVCAVMDKFNHSKGEKGANEKVKNVKDNAVYNKKSDNSLDDEEKTILTEEEIKDKNEAEGKKIIDMSRIEDPMFYQLVPDATINTYFVTYDDGTIGIVNSHGIDITGVNEAGIKNGSLSIRKMDRSVIQTDSKDSTNLDYAIYIDGSSSTHGIVFPVVNTKGQYTMEMKDIYDQDQQSMPLSMQGTGNTKDNRKYLGIDEYIVGILEQNGIEEPNDKDIETIARQFYDEGNSQPDEISVLKAYKRELIKDENSSGDIDVLDEEIEKQEDEEYELDMGERGERKPRGM